MTGAKAIEPRGVKAVEVKMALAFPDGGGRALTLDRGRRHHCFANDDILVWTAGVPSIEAEAKLFAVNPDGTELWSRVLEGDLWAAPAIDFDGTTYGRSSVGSVDEITAVVELGRNNGGYAYAPWPTARGDRANSGRARGAGPPSGGP